MHKKKREGDADKSKLFLNIVYSDQVDEPTMNKSKAGGSSWSVPYAIGPLRMEHDKSGSNLVPTFDCCFHPLSLRNAHGRKEFLDVLVNIAKDAVCASFQKSGDEVVIDSGYAILRGVSYKTGTPKSLMVSSKEQSGEAQCENDSEETQLHMPTEQAQTLAKVASGDEPIVPTYKIVEQGVFDIAEHTTKTTDTAMPRRPKKLIVHINVDEASSASDINLDVSENELMIKHDSKCRYKLELNLPYPVNSQKGKASFDKQQRTLIVTLPVVA